MHRHPSLSPPRKHQRGSVLTLLLLALVVAGGFVFASTLQSIAAVKVQRKAQTQQALVEAKEALLSWAALNRNRGALPCPEDRTAVGGITEGRRRINCANARDQLGRLPWRDLALADVRDAAGERLWYAIASDFRFDSAQTINRGTPLGNTLTLNGQGQYVALIIAPGQAEPNQSRTSATSACTATSDTRSQQYCATHYLEANAAGSNADLDRAYLTAPDLNDQIIGITAEEFLARMEDRVLATARQCLITFANDNREGTGSAANGLFPYASSLLDYAGFAPDYSGGTGGIGAYADTLGQRIGRLPDLINATRAVRLPTILADFDGTRCPLECSFSGTCGGTGAQYWRKDWREYLFYAVSERYSPSLTGGYLSVRLADGTLRNRVHAVIMIAGAPVTGQNRASLSARNQRGNYLELDNAGGTSTNGSLIYREGTSATDNDRLMIVRED